MLRPLMLGPGPVLKHPLSHASQFSCHHSLGLLVHFLSIHTFSTPLLPLYGNLSPHARPPLA
jgi:hypothetical protein